MASQSFQVKDEFKEPDPMVQDNLKTFFNKSFQRNSKNKKPSDLPEHLKPDFIPIIYTKGNDDAYFMGFNSGICIIINNIIFEKSKHNREGAEVDSEDIENCFKKFGYIVHEWRDETRKEIKKKIKKLADENLSDYHSLIIFFLTHGDDHDKLLAKDKKYNPKKFFDLFDSNKTLTGKPKVFIFQACRGYDEINKIRIQNEIKKEAAQEKFPSNNMYANWADFLVANATVPGYCAWRHRKEGTYFIQIFLKTLLENFKTEDLASILTKTNNQVLLNEDVNQISMFYSSLTHKLMLKPIAEGENQNISLQNHYHKEACLKVEILSSKDENESDTMKIDHSTHKLILKPIVEGENQNISLQNHYHKEACCENAMVIDNLSSEDEVDFEGDPMIIDNS